MFTINIPLDYKVNIVNTGNLNMKKDLFVKLDKNMMIINNYNGNFEISRYNVQRNQIVLDIRQFNIENALKIFYSF